MAGIEVFWVSGSPYAWRVLLTLEVKRLPYASRLLEVSKGDLKKPEYLALNPRGQAPTVKDGEAVLTESLAIMAYLDHKYPRPLLFGCRRARDGAHLAADLGVLGPYLDRPAGQIIAPLYFGKVAEQRDDIRAAVPRVHAESRAARGPARRPLARRRSHLGGRHRDLSVPQFAAARRGQGSGGAARPRPAAFRGALSAPCRVDASRRVAARLRENLPAPHWRQ